MKNISILFLFIFLVTSCQEVVKPDLETAPPRLVVEASINWLKGTSGNVQQVKLTTTAPYYAEKIPPANKAVVFITDDKGNQFDFIEEANTGFYKTDTFKPVMNTKYSLTVVYNGETYKAEETLLPVSTITRFEQEKENGFLPDQGQTRIKAYFDDPVDEENHYLYTFDIKDNNIFTAENKNTIGVIEDRFVNGKEIFASFVQKEPPLQIGERKKVKVDIFLRGVSKQYYNYMRTLIDQSKEGTGLFQTQPISVKGNIVNTTNPDNFAFGYFRLSETDKQTYTIK